MARGTELYSPRGGERRRGRLSHHSRPSHHSRGAGRTLVAPRCAGRGVALGTAPPPPSRERGLSCL
eukprot:4591329-Prymnesium_polylepis.2